MTGIAFLGLGRMGTLMARRVRRLPGAFAAACPAGSGAPRCADAHPVSGAAASTKFISAM
jgi:3-hydroxyisobutyrate dehydrogenase-like beta-hydroxyacid dehydrogenase